MSSSTSLFGEIKAVVYYPPAKGCPFLAVVISEGRVLTCHPVKSLTEGEGMLRELLKELPRLIEEAKEEEDA
jgi:hypothetical protein